MTFVEELTKIINDIAKSSWTTSDGQGSNLSSSRFLSSK